MIIPITSDSPLIGMNIHESMNALSENSVCFYIILKNILKPAANVALFILNILCNFETLDCFNVKDFFLKLFSTFTAQTFRN